MHDQTFFSGGVFSDTIDGGRAGADIELQLDGVHATTSAGERFFLRFSELNVDIGGYNDRMIFCRNADRSVTIFCDDKKFPKSLSELSCGVLDEQLHLKKKKLKAQAWQGRGMFMVASIAMVVGLVALYFGIKVAGAAAVQALPVSVDRQIGERSYDAMNLGRKEIHDATVVDAIQQMVDRLSPHAALQGLEFEVHVIDSEEVNAFALPGGIIVVYTGLIEVAERPEQVAGVIAHEISHATLRHGLQRVSQSLGLTAAAGLLLGDVQGLFVLATELFQLATINSYSRGQETAADTEGVRMLHAAGIDPLSLAEFFEIMKKEGPELPDGLGWISTHPEHEARIMNVRSQLATLAPQEYKGFDIDWDDVKSRIEK
ncbi:MAG: M48 family metallopeptidase [Planctomycetaceae bacterium]|nr:M48 family metallopeptidase [Planctomycetaceae bacterium]